MTPCGHSWRTIGREMCVSWKTAWNDAARRESGYDLLIPLMLAACISAFMSALAIFGHRLTFRSLLHTRTPGRSLFRLFHRRRLSYDGCGPWVFHSSSSMLAETRQHKLAQTWRPAQPRIFQQGLRYAVARVIYSSGDRVALPSPTEEGCSVRHFGFGHSYGCLDRMGGGLENEIRHIYGWLST